MITPYLPYPPYSGGQTRSYHLLKHLSKECDITLFNFVLPDQEEKYTKHLQEYCQKVITVKRGETWTLKKILFTGFSLYPFLVSNYFSSILKKKITKELKLDHYDLIHVECFYLMPNIPKADIPILLVDQTIEFAVYQHFVQTMDKKYILIKDHYWTNSIDFSLLKWTDYLGNASYGVNLPYNYLTMIGWKKLFETNNLHIIEQKMFRYNVFDPCRHVIFLLEKTNRDHDK